MDPYAIPEPVGDSITRMHEHTHSSHVLHTTHPRAFMAHAVKQLRELGHDVAASEFSWVVKENGRHSVGWTGSRGAEWTSLLSIAATWTARELCGGAA